MKITFLRVSYKKKIWKKKYFFESLKSLKKGVGSGAGSGAVVTDTDPRIRIRTNISRIHNTICYWYRWVRVWEWAGRSAAPHGGPNRARPVSWGTERCQYTRSWRLPAPGRSPVWPPGRPAPAPHKTLIYYHRYLNTNYFPAGFRIRICTVFGNWIRIRIRAKIRFLIRIQVKIQELWRAVDAQNGGLKGSVDQWSQIRITFMRSRIRIEVKSWIRIRIKVKSWH